MRVVLPITGTVQYLELELDTGVRLSVHASASEPSRLWVTGLDRRRDYRPLRLDRGQALALRDALDLAIEDLSRTQAADEA